MSEPVYLRLSDLSPRARKDAESVATDFFGGEDPWICFMGWWEGEELDSQIIPLGNRAGGYVGAFLLRKWMPQKYCNIDWFAARPRYLFPALLAAAPKE